LSTTDRWVIRNVSRSSTVVDPRTADVAALLRRAADQLEVLRCAYVNGMSLERERTPDGDVLRLSVFFDPNRMKVGAYWLHPRGATAYGASDSFTDDKLFMVKLAARLDARTVVDLGCGTGTLARELADAGRRVIAVDPSKAMIDVARSKDGAEHVRWVVGHASDVGTPEADLLVMTGNVAQCIDDDEWDNALQWMLNALRPGGYLAFGSRDPGAREWESWPEAEGNVEILAVEDGRVLTQWTDCFEDPDEILDVSGWFRFRSAGEITDSLLRAGFLVEDVHGDWDGRPLSDASPNIVVVAKKKA